MKSVPVRTGGPLLYRTLQQILAPGSTRRLAAQLTTLLAGWRPVGVTLDVGCADASLLGTLGLQPLGVELTHDRARAFGNAVQGDAMQLPVRSGAVALSFCCGLLHHLTEPQAHAALVEMHRVLADEGRLIVFDAVLPRRGWGRPLAMGLRRIDRGAYMRTQDALTALLQAALPQLTWRIERVVYAATGLEGIWCMAEARACP